MKISSQSEIVSLVTFMVLVTASLMLDVHPLPHTLIINVQPMLYDARFEVFCDQGGGLFEKPSVVRFGGASTTKMEFDFSSDSIKCLRIDPGSMPGKILIQSMKFGSFVWSADDIVRDYAPEADVSTFSSDGKTLTLNSIGVDPQFIFRGRFDRIYEAIETQDGKYRLVSRIFFVLLSAISSLILLYFLKRSRFEITIRNLASRSSLQDVTLAAIFVALLYLPLLASATGFDPEMTLLGARDRTPPKFGVTPWSKLPAQFESYFNANFGFRGLLIRYYNAAKVLWLSSSPMPKVILGKSGWLFYDSDEYPGDGVTIKDYRGIAPLSDIELASIRSTLVRNRDSLAAFGCMYVVAVAPNKNTIYDENLPDFLNRVRPMTRLDQVLQVMGDSAIHLVDLRGVLRAGKSQYPTYYQGNSHWNTFGAYLAYNEIVRTLQTQLPELVPIPLSDFSVTMQSRSTSDIAEMMALGGILRDQEVSLQRRSAKVERNNVSLYFIHDSFGTAVKWFLEQQFTPVTYAKEKQLYNFKEIRQVRPRIVLHLIAERYLDRFIQ